MPNLTRRVLAAERWPITLTYSVTVIENLLALLYPLTTGRAVDGLLAGKGVSSLQPLAAVWILHTLLGGARQIYDTRVFTSIYAELATGAVVRQRAAGISTTEAAARAVMARELVSFFELELPLLATAGIKLLGSVGMLFFYDLTAGAVIAVLLIPALIVYVGFSRRAQTFNRALNDETEREVSLIEAGAQSALSAHFKRYGALRTKLSTVEAISWCTVEAFSIAAVALLLLHATGLPGLAAGGLYAMLAYVWHVLEALEQAPLLVQRVGRLFDFRRRLDLTTAAS